MMLSVTPYEAVLAALVLVLFACVVALWLSYGLQRMGWLGCDVDAVEVITFYPDAGTDRVRLHSTP